MNLHRELEFVLTTLINLNKKCVKEILTSSEIEEQLENLRDFNKTENTLHKLALDIANTDDEEKIIDLLLKTAFSVRFIYVAG